MVKKQQDQRGVKPILLIRGGTKKTIWGKGIHIEDQEKMEEGKVRVRVMWLE